MLVIAYKAHHGPGLCNTCRTAWLFLLIPHGLTGWAYSRLNLAAMLSDGTWETSLFWCSACPFKQFPPWVLDNPDPVGLQESFTKSTFPRVLAQDNRWAQHLRNGMYDWWSPSICGCYVGLCVIVFICNILWGALFHACCPESWLCELGSYIHLLSK